MKKNYDAWVRKHYPNTRFTPLKITDDWQSAITKAFPMMSSEKLKSKLNFNMGDLLLFAIGKEDYVVSILF